MGYFLSLPYDLKRGDDFSKIRAGGLAARRIAEGGEKI
jgi:hypothetical protein